MKTIKPLLVAVIMFAVMTLNAPSIACMKQCGVTNAQITTYLQTCSHHHSVMYVRDIIGTCNSVAGIENCHITTVTVVGGVITGHIDSGTDCGG